MENLDSFPLFQEGKKGASYGSWKGQEMTDIPCALFENKLPAPRPRQLRNRRNMNEDYNPYDPLVVLVLPASIPPVHILVLYIGI